MLNSCNDNNHSLLRYVILEIQIGQDCQWWPVISFCRYCFGLILYKDLRWSEASYKLLSISRSTTCTNDRKWRRFPGEYLTRRSTNGYFMMFNRGRKTTKIWMWLIDFSGWIYISAAMDWVTSCIGLALQIGSVSRGVAIHRGASFPHWPSSVFQPSTVQYKEIIFYPSTGCSSYTTPQVCV